MTVAQAGDANYNAASAEITFKVEEKTSQVITFSTLTDKTFGDADFDLTASASSGLIVSFEVVSGPVTISGSTVSITGAVEVTIMATQQGDATYQSASVQRTFTVNKADQQITVEAISDKIISDPAFEVIASTTSGLALSYSVSGPATVSGTTITLDGTAGTVVVTVAQAGDANYNAASAEITFKVIPKTSQTITFSTLEDKTFGDSDFDLTAIASSGLIVSFEVVSGPATISGNTVSITGAGEVTITATQQGDATYQSAIVQQTFTVNKADQQITVEAISDKLNTDAAFDVVASTTSGLVLSYSVSGPATISGTTITLDGTVGTVILTVEQPGNENYNPASTDVSFNVIEKSTQVITFESISDQIFEDGTLTLLATASSGLAVNYEVVSGPATVTGNVVSFTDIGTVVVKASQPGDNSFFAADPVQQSFDVVTITGIDEETIFGISTYPNPVQNQLTLEIGNLDIERIQLFYFNGRIVREYDKDSRSFDFSNIIPGLYLLKVISSEKVDIRRIIKK